MIQTIYLEVTARCNLACAHCYQAKHRNQDLSIAKAREILSSFRTQGTESAVFTGGEPLLNQDVFDMIRFARERGMRTGVLSNGTRIDECIAEKLVQSGVDVVQISLDGVDAAHDSIRGVGAFRKTDAAIRRLLRSGITPRLRYILNRLNHEGYRQAIDYAKDLGVPVAFGVVSMFGSAVEGKLDISPERYFAIVEDLHQLKKRVYARIGSPSFSIESYLDGRPQEFPCTAATSVCVIDIEGRLLPCPFFASLAASSAPGATTTFSRESIRRIGSLPLFRVAREIKYQQHDCFLRRLQHGGFDPYSLAAFLRWKQREAEPGGGAPEQCSRNSDLTMPICADGGDPAGRGRS